MIAERDEVLLRRRFLGGAVAQPTTCLSDQGNGSRLGLAERSEPASEPQINGSCLALSDCLSVGTRDDRQSFGGVHVGIERRQNFV